MRRDAESRTEQLRRIDVLSKSVMLPLHKKQESLRGASHKSRALDSWYFILFFALPFVESFILLPLSV